MKSWIKGKIHENNFFRIEKIDKLNGETELKYQGFKEDLHKIRDFIEIKSK